MSATVEERLAAAEREIERLTTRVARLEGSAALPPVPPQRPALTWTEPPTLPKLPARPARPARQPRSLDLEDLLGGRILAVVGGAAVLIGLAFFVALAIDRGWIGETTRVAMAFAGSGLLAATGIVLAERRGRAQASLAIVGTGIGGLFLSMTAATAHYALIPDVVAFPIALGIGALAVSLAVRWDSQALAGLGIVGSLVAPAFVGADPSFETMGFLAVALAGAAAALLWRRWEWLRIAAFAVTVPQVVVWILDDAPSATPLMLVVAGTATLVLVAALGFEVRVPPAALRPSTSLLVALNALFAAGIGGLALYDEHGAQTAGLWILGVAVVHAALGVGAVVHAGLGVGAVVHGRVATEIGIVLLGASLVAGNVAFSLLADGVALTIGWAVSAALLGGLARKITGREELLEVALGGQLALAAAHTLLVDAPPSSLVDGSGDLAGAASAVLAVAAGAFTCARLAREESQTTRIALDALSIAAVAFVTALALDGAPLVLAWAAEAVALAELGRRTRDELARLAALPFLGLGAVHVLAFEAAPEGLVYGVPDLGAAALASAAVVAAGFRIWQGWGRDRESTRLGILGLASLALLYLGSIAIVDVFQPGADAFGAALDVSVRQQGQAALSAFWTLTGLAALSVGLRRRMRDLRLAGLGLLMLATGKVFLYDLATLSSTWRVLSFIVLGLLLLVAALTYQRARRGDGDLEAA